MNIAHLDYEARSGVDITEVGPHRFSIDPKFEILLAGVSRDGEDRVYLWVNPMFQTIDMMGENEEAEKILAEADLIYAHNAPNELANTWGALEQGKACPFKKLPSELIFRCTAAMSRKAGLPGSLEKLSEALSLPVKKSKDGKRLINIFCVPDEDTGEFVDPASRPDDWIAFGEYNITDVIAEKSVHQKLKPFELTGAALETFQFDLRMNQRGIPINVEAARHAQIIIDQEQSGVTEQFKKITGLRPSQKKKLKAWFDTELGLKLANMQAPTIEAEVEYRTTVCLSVDTPKSRRILEILTLYQKVGYSAVAKIAKMLECVCPDGRVRGGHMYHGAGTGRWSGKLLQPQNFKKCPPWMRPIAEEIYKLIRNGVSRDYLDYLYGDPLELISGIIRHFIHILGQPIFDGDYAQVEARIICWLAGQLDVLERWRKGEDLYKWMASHVYGVSIDSVDADQREVGKRIILGCFGPDTRVLTSRGLKPITRITSRDWLWDGIDWVRSDGVIYQGCKDTINLEGIKVTPQHAVLCERTWSEAESLVRNADIRSQALGTALGSLLSPALGSGNVGEFSFTEFDALVDHALTTSIRPVSTKETLRVVIAALRSNQPARGKNAGATLTSFQTTGFVSVFSTAFLAALPAATVRRISSFITTVVEEYVSLRGGGKTAESFSAILSRSLTTRKLQEILTGRTSIVATSPAICVSLRRDRMPTTGEALQPSKTRSPISGKKSHVYDVANAGPRNRFTIWTDNGPLIVHNCGFQMAWVKFQNSCWTQYQLRVPDEICQRGVKLFRQLCKKIRDYWWCLNNQALSAVRNPGSEHGPFRIRKIAGIPFLMFRLRSGRALAYPHPEINLVPWESRNSKAADTLDEDWEPLEDEWGIPIKKEIEYKEELTYWGEIKNGVWGRVKLYGGKLAENETQATAADFMSFGLITAEKRGMEAFMTVHDQGLAPAVEGKTAKDFEDALGTLPEWAEDFPMKVEVKVTPYYKK